MKTLKAKYPEEVPQHLIQQALDMTARQTRCVWMNVVTSLRKVLKVKV